MLTKDTLFVGKRGAKYNRRYFFVMETESSLNNVKGIFYLIVCKSTMKIIDTFDYAVESTNVMAMTTDLKETMKGCGG